MKKIKLLIGRSIWGGGAAKSRGSISDPLTKARSGNTSFEDLKKIIQELSRSCPVASDFLVNLKRLELVDEAVINDIKFENVTGKKDGSGKKRWEDLQTLFAIVQVQEDSEAVVYPSKALVYDEGSQDKSGYKRVALAMLFSCENSNPKLNEALRKVPLDLVQKMGESEALKDEYKKIHEEMGAALSSEYQRFVEEIQACSVSQKITTSNIDTTYPEVSRRMRSHVICEEAPMKRIISSLWNTSLLDTSSEAGAFWDAYSSDYGLAPEKADEINCADQKEVQACIDEQLALDLEKLRSEVESFCRSCDAQNPDNTEVNDFILQYQNEGVLKVEHSPTAQKCLARLVVQGKFARGTEPNFVDDISEEIWGTVFDECPEKDKYRMWSNYVSQVGFPYDAIKEKVMSSLKELMEEIKKLSHDHPNKEAFEMEIKALGIESDIDFGTVTGGKDGTGTKRLNSLGFLQEEILIRMTAS